MAFSVPADVRPMIETVAPARAHEACRKMRRGAAKFRMVPTMENT